MALRVLIAGLLVAVAVGGGLWLHGYRQTERGWVGGGVVPGGHGIYSGDLLSPTRGKVRVKPAWADPVALGGGIAALALGAALIVGRRAYFAKPS